MSVLLPHRRTHLVVLGLVLIDLPAFAAVAVAGYWYGWVDTYEALTAWRLEHPWSLLPSLLLAVLLIRRWRRARAAGS